MDDGYADGHGGNAAKDGGMRFAFSPYAFCWLWGEKAVAILGANDGPASRYRATQG